MSLAVLVPVLGRPHRVEPLLASFTASTPEPRESVLFICDPDDRDEIDAVWEAGCKPLTCAGGYAAKIRFGVESSAERLIFTGADDLDFRPGWFEAAEAHIDAGAQVVGVNDLIPREHEHATHFLMTRQYAERPTIDGQPGPFFEGYSHWYVDDELIATAKRRGVYAYAEDAHVAHLHPMVGAPDDETYRKGRAEARLDGRKFRRREALWI